MIAWMLDAIAAHPLAVLLLVLNLGAGQLFGLMQMRELDHRRGLVRWGAYGLLSLVLAVLGVLVVVAYALIHWMEQYAWRVATGRPTVGRLS